MCAWAIKTNYKGVYEMTTKELILIILAIFVLYIFAQVIANRIKVHDEVVRRKKEEKERVKKEEKKKWKYSKVDDSSNELFDSILQTMFIVFMGVPGSGKTILLNLLTKYAVEKREKQNEKNRRFNKFMKSDYLEKEEELKESNLLPVYSNLKLQDRNSGAVNQELLPYITLSKKAVQECVFVIDEISSTFGKDLYFDTELRESELMHKMEELTKKGRHYLKCHFIGTEQDGEDIYKGFRQNGYVLVKALSTVVFISKYGKFKRKLLNLINVISPAIFRVNLGQILVKKLFLKDKVTTILKALLPPYFLMPIEFYKNKIKINEIIKEQYQRYITKLQYNGGEYYMKYNNSDLYKYNTREYKYEYDNLFNKKGERL